MALHRIGVVVVLCALVAAAPARAQNKGLYIPGQFGLNAGTLPDPGITYNLSALKYWSNNMKGPNGEDVPMPGADAYWVQMNTLTYVPALKVLGGNMAFAAMVPIANGSVTVPRWGNSNNGFDIGDIFVQPFALGWRWAKVDLNAGYGFVAPTGKYTAGSTTNVGAGYWGHMITSGSTVYLSRHGSTRANLYMNWETHGHVKDSEYTPGQAFTFEWGISHVFPIDRNRTALLELGIVGYDQSKVSEDGGRAAVATTPIETLSPMYRVHAAGPQVNLRIPAEHLTLFAKWVPEYSATNRPQGHTFAFGARITVPFGGEVVVNPRP